MNTDTTTTDTTKVTSYLAIALYTDRATMHACAVRYTVAATSLEEARTLAHLVLDHEPWLRDLLECGDDHDWECHPIRDSGINAVHVFDPRQVLEEEPRWSR